MVDAVSVHQRVREAEHFAVRNGKVLDVFFERREKFVNGTVGEFVHPFAPREVTFAAQDEHALRRRHVDQWDPEHDLERRILGPRIAVQGQHRTRIARQLDREADAALHRQLVADQRFEDRAAAGKVGFAKPRRARQRVDDGQAQVVEAVRVGDEVADPLEKPGRVGGRRESEKCRRAFDDEVADAIECGAVLSRRNHVSVFEKRR